MPRRWAVVFALVVALVLCCTCGGGGAVGRIQTSAGPYAITKVEMMDRWPRDCVPDCRLGPGARLAVVWFQQEFEGASIAFGAFCSGEPEQRAYIEADDGTRTPCSEAELFTDMPIARSRANMAFVFSLQKLARGLTLFVPGNPPVGLDK